MAEEPVGEGAGKQEEEEEEEAVEQTTPTHVITHKIRFRYVPTAQCSRLHMLSFLQEPEKDLPQTLPPSHRRARAGYAPGLDNEKGSPPPADRR